MLTGRRNAAVLAVALLLAGTAGAARQPAAADAAIALGAARQLAPGVELFHHSSTSVLGPNEPTSIWLLSVDPTRAVVRAAIANDEIVDTEPVAALAARRHAVAAVNAGFFAPNGDPSGVLAVNRRLVSDTRRPRGAVGIVDTPAGQQLIFGRLRATAAATIRDPKGSRKPGVVPIDGIDTTRLRGKTMLFTPDYDQTTGTAGAGLEWTVAGSPGRVVGAARSNGNSAIPPDGFVLSFGGPRASGPLTRLRPGARVEIDVTYRPEEGDSRAWSAAHDIVGGAGLLIRDGIDVADLTPEVVATGFVELRHPRTLIGTRADGTIWLVTVDGRQPSLSVGMTLAELRAFARRLGLTNALNLDGGGSTTMWAAGEVKNSPSDAAGPRPVSDALLVFQRQ